jgi:hypothetical protein
MKINSKHYTLLMFSIASIVITIFAYVFIYNKTITQADHYVEANSEVLKEGSKRNSEQELIKIHESTKLDRDRLLNFLVPEDKIVNFIESVEKVGEYSNTELELSSITTEGDKVKTKVNVKGGWSSVMTALVLLENLPYSSYISNVKIDSSTDTKVRWTMSLDLEAILIKNK